jgi:outer membrane protein assembly factor BamA
MKYTRIILLFPFLAVANYGYSQVEADSIENEHSKIGLVNKIVSYFESTNKPEENKRFDFSIIGGPHYSSSTSFGVGLVAAGLYKRNLEDSIAQPSYVGVYADITVKLYFKIGVDGYHIFKDKDWRVEYDLSFLSNPTKFWGIGYYNGKNTSNETEYKKWQVSANIHIMRNLGDKFYIGPELNYNYTRACDIDGNIELWRDQAMHTSDIGLGFSLAYDTRDNLSNAYTGVYMKLSQMFYPSFFGNKYSFSSTEYKFKCYKPLRIGTLLACQLHGVFTYGTTPWGMMPMLGNNETMRGYYEGRYIDKDLVDVTFELRQHLYKRHSVVCWIGAGEVFSNTSHFSFGRILPNCGIGYRWEFKQRVNVRLDLGFGRRQTGVIFSINEAF